MVKLGRERKEETYFLGNKPKGPVAGDWRLSACTNTHKKELNTTGFNDSVHFLQVVHLVSLRKKKKHAMEN